MQYMFLIYHSPESEPVYGTPEFQAMMAGFNAFTEKTKADGVFCSGEGLQGVSTAKSLRLRGGKVDTFDGPFAETKEMVGGFFLIDCATRNEAVAIARECPAAEWATIEVREVAPCYHGAVG